MVITLIAHEKNLGLLTLTDYILENLGKNNCAVVGSNYLVSNIDPILQKIDLFSKDNKSVIIKYVVPKMKFSNQEINYPKELNHLSDIVLRVPKFTEELQKPTNIEVYKGLDNPFLDKIKNFYI
jgi:hypothetical protein